MATESRVGKNVALSVDGNILTIKIDLSQNFGRSKGKPASGGHAAEPGKNDIVASTSGNVLIPGTDIHLGVNAYKPPVGG